MLKTAAEKDNPFISFSLLSPWLMALKNTALKGKMDIHRTSLRMPKSGFSDHRIEKPENTKNETRYIAGRENGKITFLSISPLISQMAAKSGANILMTGIYITSTAKAGKKGSMANSKKIAIIIFLFGFTEEKFYFFAVECTEDQHAQAINQKG